MASARMFDDILLLEPGDVFVPWAPGDPLGYELTGGETVLPEETEPLACTGGLPPNPVSAAYVHRGLPITVEIGFPKADR